MKTIIAGTRTITEAFLVYMAILDSKFHVTEVVSGGCSGVDTLGEEWARSHDIPVKRFQADWEAHGMAAGPIRNSNMARYADALIAIWDGKSNGTADMIRKAKAHGLKVFVKYI